MKGGINKILQLTRGLTNFRKVTKLLMGTSLLKKLLNSSKENELNIVMK